MRQTLHHPMVPRPEPEPADPDQGLAPWLAERLFERRIVFLRGPVTSAMASEAAAALLSLDALADDPIQLHFAAPDGELDAVFALIDTIDGLRAPVHAIATAQVGAAAIGVYAVAGRRIAYPHARFRLAEPRVTHLAGTADDIAAAAGRHLRALEELVVRVADATGKPRSRVEDDFSTGVLLDADQARDYGLVDEIANHR
ncbi:MAG TPA: ATP-dependent Clp protease proteolytic subunit [Natronosporangium sp.]